MLYRQKYSSQATSGFSMIELLVVIVIIGVIAAIAAPSWLSFMDRQRMNAARSDLMGALKSAQDQAQARQQSQEVTFLPVTASTPLSIMVRNASASTSGLITRLGEGEVGDKFNLVASTPIVFDHDGRVDVTTPYVIKIINTDAPPDASGSRPQSCVIVTTLLGGLKPANDDLCDSF